MPVLQLVPINTVEPGTRFSLHEGGFEKYPLIMMNKHDEVIKPLLRKLQKRNPDQTLYLWLTWNGNISCGYSSESVWIEIEEKDYAREQNEYRDPPIG